MKKNVKKDIHNGDQPIRVLKHNLTHRLVDRNEELIKSLQTNSSLENSITYHVTPRALINKQTPYIDDNGMINIHETFMSYIWTISFSMFVLYEEGMAIPDQIKRNIPTHKKQNLELIEIAKELFDYSKSLIRVYSKWDMNYFPNPEFYDEDTEEGWYILRTNDLYVEIMNFILYHEIAHAELEHIQKINIAKLDNNSIKLLEIEADTRAINLMLENCRSLKVTEMSIIIGLASMIFCNRDLNGGEKHPDIDVRIENAINIIKPNIENPVWAFLVLFLKLWDEQFSHNFIHKSDYHNFKDFYYELIEQAKQKNFC